MRSELRYYGSELGLINHPPIKRDIVINCVVNANYEVLGGGLAGYEQALAVGWLGSGDEDL